MAKSVSFQAPNEYSTEAEEIQRRRKYAELLQAQSMDPLQSPQTPAGGFAVPISPLAGLAKMLQAYSGRKGLEDATAQQKALGERYTTERGAALAAAMRAGQGAPASSEQIVDEQAMGGEGAPAQINAPAVPGGKRAMLASLSGSKFPDLQQLALAEAIKGQESLFSKIDPKDYTSASVSAYAASQDPSVLVPVRKMEALTGAGPTGAPETQFYNPYAPPTGPVAQPIKREMVNTGNAITPVNPYAPPATLPIAVSPNTTYTQGQENYRHNTASGSTLSSNATSRANNAATNATTQRGQDLGVNPEVQAAVAQARASGKEFGEAGAQAVITLPAAIAKAKQAVDLIDQMIGDLNVDATGKLAFPAGMTKPRQPHAGFSVGVGASVQPGFQYIPGTDKAGFYALKDQVLGGAFLQAFETLKGGGQITVIEGEKATSAITRMKTAQSEPEFVKAAREFQEVVKAGAERAQAAASRAGNQQRRASDATPAIRFDAQGNRIQ